MKKENRISIEVLCAADPMAIGFLIAQACTQKSPSRRYDGCDALRFCASWYTMSPEPWMNITQLKNNGRMSVEARYYY